MIIVLKAAAKYYHYKRIFFVFCNWVGKLINLGDKFMNLSSW